MLAREGTFSKASQRLGLSQPAVSERIRQLEEAVGQPLIIRSVPVTPTPAGQRLLNHFHEVSLMESSVIEALGMGSEGDQKGAIVPIAVNFDSLATWFIPAVSAILEKGNCLLQIQAVDQRLTVEELKAGRVVACVTSSPSPPSGCVSEPIGKFTYVCVAAPSFIERYFSKPPSLKELVSAPAVIYGKDDYVHDEFLKKHFRREYPAPTYLYIPHIIAMKEAVTRGFAYSLMPERLVREEMRAGKLREVLPGKRLVTELYFHSTDIKTPILDTLRQVIRSGGDRL